jgi:DNA-binding response OmpR family regulator
VTTSPAAHILLVEDEPTTAETVELYLRDAGFRVSRAADGAEGLRLARSLGPDLVLLDLALPVIDGLEVCRSLRAEGSLPIIMVTARTTEDDRIGGLELGADDYVPKPFSPRELVSRVRAVLRRAAWAPVEDRGRLSFDGLVLDGSARSLRADGRIVGLTPTEFELLAVLLRAPGRVFSRSELITRVFGHDFDGEERTVDVHVKNLRRKLLTDPDGACWIRTVFGVGYQLMARDAG